MRVATDRVKVLSFTMVLAGGVPTDTGGACPLTPGARGEPQRRVAILRCVPAPDGRGHRLGMATDTGGASRRAPVRTVSETCPNPSGTLFEHRRARTAS